MNASEWLRAMAGRQRRKSMWIAEPVNAAAASAEQPTPAMILRNDAVLSGADVDAFVQRWNAATISPNQLSVGAMRVTSGMQCGCEARYTSCRCGRGDP